MVVMRLFPLNAPSSCTHPVLILLFTMSYRGVSRLRPTATLRLVTSTPNPDTDEDSNSSLSSFSSHSEEKLSRGGTEAHQIEPAETPPRIRVPLTRQTEIDNYTVADNSDRKETVAEPTQVDEDWKMRSPSPIELNYAPIELTYAPTHFHQLYEYQDIVMASPPRSPTPNEVQDSATWGSSWGRRSASLPHSQGSSEFLYMGVLLHGAPILLATLLPMKFRILRHGSPHGAPIRLIPPLQRKFRIPQHGGPPHGAPIRLTPQLPRKFRIPRLGGPPHGKPILHTHPRRTLRRGGPPHGDCLGFHPFTA
ncbi:hypothetical protein F4604DRAFT_435956 [Suillus subluteus]|nr:hypothetical protein F4604DRAFT_435956 [Suillus subluteus]